MIRACIDIGSNTTRLLVADCTAARLEVLHEERVFTHLGRELSGGKPIPPARSEALAGIVAGLLASARAHGAGWVRAIATAAVRSSPEGPGLMQRIADETGLRVAIIPGEEEARLAFVGAAAMMDPAPSGSLGVVDVGGGSSEIVVGEPPRAVHWWRSLALGSAQFGSLGDPPAAERLAAVQREVRDAVADLAAPPAATVVAVGGSATSLGRLIGPVLDEPALEGALRTLAEIPVAELGRRYEIHPDRARLLPSGLLILREIVQRMGGTMSVGRGGVREGVLLEGPEGGGEIPSR